MISFNEAQQFVVSRVQNYGTELVDLLHSSGRILAEDILADRDFPPFNRATKDGIAVVFDAVENGRLSFEIRGVLPAGQPTVPFVERDSCIEIMTGAVVPFETDAVVMYEEVVIKDDIASLKKIPVRGQNIHQRGSDHLKGDVLIEKNTKITPAELGILATVGKNRVLVQKLPRVAIISTGNELVDVEQHPLIHQIRKSNSYSLFGALQELGITPMLLHIADDIDLLRQKLSYVMDEMDVLILSGGVSKGKFDYIPQVLSELGAEKIFHRVAQRPGKPFWFGINDNSKTLIFSFPGNPVSTYYNFYLYFKPWLLSSLRVAPPERQVKLNSTVENTSDLTVFLGVAIQNKNGDLHASIVEGSGSGDLVNLSKINGIVRLGPGHKIYTEGSIVPFVATKTSF
ncbi:molybdopterin molybdotransferase MoeA [Muriicola sp.]|uniref:molybdopterin molybdotransferase MoeA n=1 Tax=Muriicola sp. TaxID=2020856 RepID=UPI003C73A0A9